MADLNLRTQQEPLPEEIRNNEETYPDLCAFEKETEKLKIAGNGFEKRIREEKFHQREKEKKERHEQAMKDYYERRKNIQGTEDKENIPNKLTINGPRGTSDPFGIQE